MVAIKNVTDANDIMIINKSGIVIRLSMKECRLQGRATQGVRLINLTKKNDIIASVCKVMGAELESLVEQESRAAWAKINDATDGDDGMDEDIVVDDAEAPMIELADDADTQE